MLFKWSKPGEADSDVAKLSETSLSKAGIKERDLENIIAKKIEEIVRTDQLMVILQERRRKEEPDILAVDEQGNLFIFELKRWSGKAENLLQVMRYGQKFGRYDYERLNMFFGNCSRSDKADSLADAHRRYFELSEPLKKERFNREQHFVVVVNGLDYDTWEAISFWQEKGLKITPFVYRVYSIGENIYVDFDPFGPFPDSPRRDVEGLYVVNTNSTYMPEAYFEMVEKRRCSAFYGRKYALGAIRKGDPVALYHNDVGILGIGKAKSECQARDIAGEKDEEYYVPVEFEQLVDVNAGNWQAKCVKAWEINAFLNTSYRFRQTVFRLPPESYTFIKDKLKGKAEQRMQ